MKNVWPLAFMILWGLLAQSARANCFAEHVREGRALNSERKDLYRNWASEHDLGGRAKLISNAFTGLETLMLPMAKIYDRKARQWESIGLFCDDFIPISETPEFKTTYAQIPSVSYLSKPSFLKTFEKEIRRLLKKQDWASIRYEAIKVIEVFPSAQTHCLTRHFVESLGRIAALAPGHLKNARDLSLDDPSNLIARMIRFHLFGLDYALKIDALAAPLQYKGIPIVCQDVPKISIPAIGR